MDVERIISVVRKLELPECIIDVFPSIDEYYMKELSLYENGKSHECVEVYHRPHHILLYFTVNGIIHREIGPAEIRIQPYTMLTSWYFNGQPLQESEIQLLLESTNNIEKMKLKYGYPYE